MGEVYKARDARLEHTPLSGKRFLNISSLLSYFLRAKRSGFPTSRAASCRGEMTRSPKANDETPPASDLCAYNNTQGVGIHWIVPKDSHDPAPIAHHNVLPLPHNAKTRSAQPERR